MNSASQSQNVLGPRAQTNAEPSASVDFAIVNRFGTTISTAGDEDTAKRACRRLLARHEGLTVVRVETTITRTLIYRPRALRSVS